MVNKNQNYIKLLTYNKLLVVLEITWFIFIFNFSYLKKKKKKHPICQEWGQKTKLTLFLMTEIILCYLIFYLVYYL